MELDTDNGLNLYDYDARQMDVISGRFTSVLESTSIGRYRVFYKSQN